MKTWLACLLGRRSAILELADARGTFPAGLLLLLSAGLAREYDGVFLPLEPWRLLVPFAVSAGMGALLWSAFFLAGREQPGAVALRSFLGVFWMSAPLAWLYGVPYERFLSPLDAFHANLWTLAFVSIWRVVWVTRVVSVLRGGRTLPTLFRVLLCADVVVFVVAYLSPRPVIDFMGGTEGSPLEEAVGLTNDDLMWGAGLAFTILAVAAFVSAPRIGAQAPAAAPSGTRLDRRLTAFALASAFAWLLPTPVAQVEQYWRWSVERDLRGGRIERALAALSARSPDDFPPHWDPPPHAFFEDDEPSIHSILASILQQPPAGWVTERFVPKVFHGYYGEGDSYADRLEGLVARWAEDRGEEEARALLELIAAHAGLLTPRQREAMDDLLARARAGTRLLPDAGDQWRNSASAAGAEVFAAGRDRFSPVPANGSAFRGQMDAGRWNPRCLPRSPTSSSRSARGCAGSRGRSRARATPTTSRRTRGSSRSRVRPRSAAGSGPGSPASCGTSRAGCGAAGGGARSASGARRGARPCPRRSSSSNASTPSDGSRAR